MWKNTAIVIGKLSRKAANAGFSECFLRNVIQDPVDKIGSEKEGSSC